MGTLDLTPLGSRRGPNTRQTPLAGQYHSRHVRAQATRFGGSRPSRMALAFSATISVMTSR
jgi:hypothetical protein